ncbi:hypothetical protein L3Q82_000148 [Scortum barcoo]|uniref:Uncharacterized protein n=1 Tax=Scortum barcoo TaxID=214431 RepID=A0ACB8X9U4_9TELE|nr:hypothetical protein L3Q82_000148 [Scortum barcoo]
MSHREEAWGRPRTRWRNYVSRLAWERLGVPPEELEEVSGNNSNSDLDNLTIKSSYCPRDKLHQTCIRSCFSTLQVTALTTNFVGYSHRQIHLALLDNEDRTERLTLQDGRAYVAAEGRCKAGWTGSGQSVTAFLSWGFKRLTGRPVAPEDPRIEKPQLSGEDVWRGGCLEGESGRTQ